MSTLADRAEVSKRHPKTMRSRTTQVHLFSAYQKLMNQGWSERKVAIQLGVPRTTLQAWRRCSETIDANPEVRDFFESEPGLAFLHRLTVAMHVVFVEVGACGIRLISKMLKLSGLDRFVASSYEAQRRFNLSVEQGIIDHATSERKRLATNMPAKDITVAQDETFKGGMTLVAIEPVSNFILLEQTSKKRDRVAWEGAMGEALADLNCNVIQSTSDEARGLLAYTENVLGAQHSPDLFHVQQELSRAVSAPIAAKVRAAERNLEKARERVRSTEEAAREYQEQAGARGPGRPPEWSSHIDKAKQETAGAQAEAERLAEVRQKLRSEIKGIGKDYHFADLDSGVRRSGGSIIQKIRQRIESIREKGLAEEVAEHSMERIAKAERVLPKMAATINFVSSYVLQQVDKLKLSGSEVYLFHSKLIPAAYLERCAAKMRKSDAKPLQDKAAELSLPLFSDGGAFCNLSETYQLLLKSEAKRLADIFQRSSSCVEGRNGVLSFRHHGLSGIGPRKRQCLTALHNFFCTRRDGTTPAGRFFGSEPRDTFQAVLARVEVPRRPKSPPRKSVRKHGGEI